MTVSLATAATICCGAEPIDELAGGNDNDELYGGTGDDDLSGDNGDDFLWGGAGADDLFGGYQGKDTASYKFSPQGVLVNLTTNHGHDGDAEGDLLYEIEDLHGSDFGDELTGDTGDNELWGFVGWDRLYGEDGVDTLMGGADTDYLFGGTGGDTLDGGSEQDFLYGEAGTDTLKGDSGPDRLDGGKDWDTLHGGSHDDSLIGGAGGDDLWGEGGSDTFIFGTGDALFDGINTTEWIRDYQDNADKVNLRDYGPKLQLVERTFSGDDHEVMITHGVFNDKIVSYISIDLDGDLKVDEQIGVEYYPGSTVLDQSDLIL
jgi:Ca2+-binding RTX toxin-like protein